jgi:[methyl-Co(III) methanol-specific corrinoid protein]:coenzyme M methyltransferase
LQYIRQTGLECFHFDSKVPTADARRLAGEDLALMGGTSNIDVVRNGSPEEVRRDVEEKLRLGVDVIGPECAVPLDAPYQNLKTLVDVAKGLSGE